MREREREREGGGGGGQPALWSVHFYFDRTKCISLWWCSPWDLLKVGELWPSAHRRLCFVFPASVWYRLRLHWVNACLLWFWLKDSPPWLQPSDWWKVWSSRWRAAEYNDCVLALVICGWKKRREKKKKRSTMFADWWKVWLAGWRCCYSVVVIMIMINGCYILSHVHSHDMVVHRGFSDLCPKSCRVVVCVWL